jgi:hypothetical protein
VAAVAAVAVAKAAQVYLVLAEPVETEMAMEPTEVIHQHLVALPVADLEPSEQHLAEPVLAAQVS